ncbi:MAG: ABC transporter permease [Anaerolineae bacterium]|jgi:simple sugar transport system permease protein|nr:ABC transporter permease [Anaerolineae bacterium]
MNPRRHTTFRSGGLLILSVLIGLLLALAISARVFGVSAGMGWDEMRAAIQSAPDYGGILLVNALIGISVFLLILELRLDALRVILTVAVALVFGYLMTAFFNLDAASRFASGEFRVNVVTEGEPLVDIYYGDRPAAEFTAPDAENPLTEARYRFAGAAGDVVTIMAFAEEEESPLDLQVTLLGPDGATVAENLDASDAQREEYRRQLESAGDAILENVELPADGVYTLVVKPEPDAEVQTGEFNVRLDTEAVSPIDTSYNQPVGAVFNDPKAEEPIAEAAYRFPGQAGDVVSVLAYAYRSNIEVDLEAELVGPDGEVLGEAASASPEQLATFRGLLQRATDAAIEDVTLPEDGIYTVRVRPEPVSFGTKLDETIKATNKAYDAFLFGPVSRLNRWVTWIKDAITLIMLGLAIAIVFRAEQFSLGAEGQLYFGALVSGVIGLSFGELPMEILVPLALLSAATAGFLWGLLPGALKAYLGANELVSTLMLNTIAMRFYEMVLTFQLQPPDAGYTASEWIPGSGLLAPIIDISGDQVTIAVFVLIAMILFTWLLIQRTPIGYEIRMIGSNIKFADYGGVNTKRTIMLTMAISGAVAGLAGAHLAMGIHRKLILNISLGMAFEGVVVALLARNNPLVVPFTGLLYSYLRTGAQFMERDANVSSEVVRIIQAVVILLITAEALVSFFRKRRLRSRDRLSTEIAPSEQLMATPPQPPA